MYLCHAASRPSTRTPRRVVTGPPHSHSERKKAVAVQTCTILGAVPSDVFANSFLRGLLFAGDHVLSQSYASHHGNTNIMIMIISYYS